MIYVCVPAHNEAHTIGLVLWKVRQVFTAFPREYQLLVADDGSNDGTGAVLASYAKVLPLTVLTHPARQGYAKSLEELLRLALQRTDRPKRDCAITLHADFVHSPETMEEMVKRIESGADLIVAELVEQRGRAPRALRLARRWTPRLLRVPGVKDTVSGFCALRLIVLRQALGGAGGVGGARRDGAPLPPSGSASSTRRSSASSTSAPLPWRSPGSIPSAVLRPCTWCSASAAGRCGTTSSRSSSLGWVGATFARAASGTRRRRRERRGSESSRSTPTPGSTARPGAIPRSQRCRSRSMTRRSCTGFAPSRARRESATPTTATSARSANP